MGNSVRETNSTVATTASVRTGPPTSARKTFPRRPRVVGSGSSVPAMSATSREYTGPVAGQATVLACRPAARGRPASWAGAPPGRGLDPHGAVEVEGEEEAPLGDAPLDLRDPAGGCAGGDDTELDRVARPALDEPPREGLVAGVLVDVGAEPHPREPLLHQAAHQRPSRDRKS